MTDAEDFEGPGRMQLFKQLFKAEMSRKLSNYKGSSQVKLKKSVSYINIGLQKYIKHLNNFF